MRVLHVLASIDRSGAETMLRDSAELFLERGVHTIALATGASPGGLVPSFREAGISVRHLPFSRSPSFFLKLWTVFLRERPDVLNIHTERASFWIGLVGRLARIRAVVRTVHSVFGFEDRLRRVRMLQRWISSKVLRVQFVFVGASVEANERARFAVNGVLVPNSVDTLRFRPVRDVQEKSELRARMSVPAESLVLVSVGRCIDSKQHSHVLECVAALRDSPVSLYYLHLGDGPLCCAERDLAAQLDIEDKVRFCGERDDIPEVLRMCDIFVMPSKYEGLGVAVLEAAACGLPVVAYDVPGLRDAVLDGVTGRLVPPHVEALVEAILGLQGDARLRHNLGCGGTRHIRDCHSMDQWAERLLTVYERALGQGGR